MESCHITSRDSKTNKTPQASTTVTTTATANVKPCCVCKDEKTLRDDCMLFSTSQDPTQNCAEFINKYKKCMATYGFNI
ncbi:Cytochrome c oxidase copper chaperone [Erysiphe neolycopersici]|uniref:Cytochrome c oxidase copper chaperone n=1 Tax=Erysiphe neolycopersici TaxID=212602 RepID=A0A420HD19_9PEZI|nr:Cytochrome c oxidase copper chaperone [Erysiphe neolycopersici]